MPVRSSVEVVGVKTNEYKYAYIDALRGVAILMVILVHTAQQIPMLGGLIKTAADYCQMGVQLFFVISSYTLCLSFERRSPERYRIISFYIRRFFRIAPLYYTGIAVYFGIFVVRQLYKNGDYLTIDPYNFSNIFANILFVHAFIPSANNTIVPGGWSIATEMLFYLIFPAIFLLGKKISDLGCYKLFWLVLVAVIFNCMVQFYFFKISGVAIENNSFMYFSLLNQIPVFCVGIVLYFIHAKYDRLAVSSGPVASIIGFVSLSILALVLWMSEINEFFLIIPTIAAVSFAFLFNLFKKYYRFNGLLRKVGSVSFSMYVFHFIFVRYLAVFLILYLEKYLPAELLLVVAFVAVAFVTYFVALLTEKNIESKGIWVGATIVKTLQAWSMSTKKQVRLDV